MYFKDKIPCSSSYQDSFICEKRHYFPRWCFCLYSAKETRLPRIWTLLFVQSMLRVNFCLPLSTTAPWGLDFHLFLKKVFAYFLSTSLGGDFGNSWNICITWVHRRHNLLLLYLGHVSFWERACSHTYTLLYWYYPILLFNSKNCICRKASHSLQCW